MKKKVYYALLCMLVLNCTTVYAASNDNQDIIVKDANLEMCIKTQLDNYETPLTSDELSSLTTLECSDQNIIDLDGLEYATNIRTLNLSSNQITDIKELAYLHNLVNLNLNDNKITDISSLAGVSRMYELSLNGNRISDIAPLSSLSYVKRLDLANNSITNISPLRATITDDVSYDFSNQNVYLDDSYVISEDEVEVEILGLNGKSSTVELGVPTVGATNLVGEWEQTQTGFSGTINQSVIYNQLPISATQQVSITEGNSLDDNQLLEKFDVSSPLIDTVEVNHKRIDYSKPNEYSVKFTVFDSRGDKATVKRTLVVEDELPSLEISTSTILIEKGSTRQDILEAVDYNASEFKDGDLNPNVEIDTSDVNFNQSGVYPVEFKVEDDDGNSATKLLNVSII